MNRLNYEKVFKTLVEETGNYLVNHSLRAMVLGVSGGIDSTVVAAICCEVNKQTNIPLIGRSLPNGMLLPLVGHSVRITEQCL
jgi:NH3-dependent NAD+ synthetase